MQKAQYQLINPNAPITKEDFSKIVALIGQLRGIGVNTPENEPNTAYVFYENLPLTPKLTLEINKTETKIILETDLADGLTSNIFKGLLAKYEIKLFFINLNSFLPERPDIIECITLTTEDFMKSKRILEKYGLNPIFVLENTFTYYAENQNDKSIHIINDNLLYHLGLSQNEVEKPEELNYKVAENIQDFVRKMDAELIPTLFYAYYKKPLKIMNYSGFDIENPGRKVFIKPYILEFNKEKLDFFKIANDGSPLLYMDKIREGESLDKALVRILKEDLKISNDYLGAVVARMIEYDLDKQGSLTPRLIVRVYVEEAQLTKEQSEKKDRTWISLDQIKK